ncbi:MAG: gluconate 2-dehydrogenase subunit 3 family protein [Bdellovibrionota bacterium]
MKRRTFLALGAQAAIVASTASAAPSVRAAAKGFLAQSEERLLGAVLEILLPHGDDGSPGASDLHALEYILTVLNDPEIDETDKSTIQEGLIALDRFTRGKRGRSFADLSIKDQQSTFEDFVEDGDGEDFASMLLSYLMEALFGDPSYGVNTDESGWRWINHHPGFPRPPGPKWYRQKLRT